MAHQFCYGPGSLWGKRKDILNATPQMFATVQEVSFDIQGEIKELYGKYTYPVATARGTSKITGKIKDASINGLLMADLFFGVTPSTGMLKVAESESGTIPSSTAYTVTVANGATMVEDLGVFFSVTGLPLTKVASNPTTGQYSVVETTGVYTFAEADKGLGVKISYSYTYAASGSKIVLTNQLIGAAPYFSIMFAGNFEGDQTNILLNHCVSSKLALSTKLTDYVIPELDFSASADYAGNVLTLSTTR